MTIEAFIEIPKGSHHKYEVDEETGKITLDRVLYGPITYPFEYGFMKDTLGGDGDPLDVLVLTTYPTFPGCAMEVEVIGYLETEDERGIDHKVIAVPTKKVDPRWSNIQDVSDLSEHQRKEIAEFFEIYKRLEPGKWVKVQDFKGKAEAEKLIEEAQKRHAG